MQRDRCKGRGLHLPAAKNETLAPFLKKSGLIHQRALRHTAATLSAQRQLMSQAEDSPSAFIWTEGASLGERVLVIYPSSGYHQQWLSNAPLPECCQRLGRWTGGDSDQEVAPRLLLSPVVQAPAPLTLPSTCCIFNQPGHPIQKQDQSCQSQSPARCKSSQFEGKGTQAAPF